MDADFNWTLLAEVAATKSSLANLGAGAFPLEWATIGVLVYDRLTHSSDPLFRDSYSLSAMILRSNMIATFGPESNHPVLDPQLVEDWFFRELNITYEEASDEVKQWDDLPSRHRFRLFDIKARLEPIRTLLGKGLIQRIGEVMRWQQLLDAIPPKR
jgi:hypothetical protein